MNKYEALFILKPNMEDEKRAEAIEKFKSIIAADGEVLNVDEWGNRKLAYEIEKVKEGYYVLIDFNAAPALPAELERNFRISDAVMRFMVVRKEA
jgi:small subunit ribosomal protein S6